MRRTSILIIMLALALGSLSTDASAEPRFQVRCRPTRVARVDPIVAPGQRSEHQHEFFGNRSTNKDSTYRSMRRGSTNCSTKADTAGYWAPTLFRPDDTRVKATSLLIYYRGEPGERTRPFPKNLRIISKRFGIGPDPSKIIVKFPECWNGRRIRFPQPYEPHGVRDREGVPVHPSGAGPRRHRGVPLSGGFRRRLPSLVRSDVDRARRPLEHVEAEGAREARHEMPRPLE